MNFKDLLKEDQKVFFNAEEMADELTINGIEITGILDEDKFNPSKNDQYGVYIENKILNISTNDWEKLGSPAFGHTLNFNECNYKIKDFSDKLGVVELKLEGNRT